AADGVFTICMDPNWVNCIGVLFTKDVCVNVPTGWNDAVSSVSLTAPMICRMSKDIGCQSSNILAASPGYDDLRGQFFDDTMSSFKCSTASTCVSPPL
ncbi:hypothetical protein C8J56DRAFT_793488, partial [Mycena floridula]